jgi:hypothetical protein
MHLHIGQRQKLLNRTGARLGHNVIVLSYERVNFSAKLPNAAPAAAGLRLHQRSIAIHMLYKICYQFTGHADGVIGPDLHL